jgi:acetyl esterase/lipase
MASFKSHFIAFVLKHTRKKAFRSVEGLHARIAQMRPVEDPKPGDRILARLEITEHRIEGATVYEAKPKSGAVTRRILYLHGGAYCFEMTPFHWNLVAQLAEELNAHVTVPIYPLAPENDFHRIYQVARAVYRQVFTENPNAMVAGDSAGGNMALVLTMMAAEDGLPLPHKLALISPGIDMTMANPETIEYAKSDPWLDVEGGRESVRLYKAGLDYGDWRISPMYGDLTVLPPTILFSGTRDMLYPDSVVFAGKVKAAGGHVDLVTGKGMIHVWPLIDMPEALPARRRLVEFLAA